MSIPRLSLLTCIGLAVITGGVRMVHWKAQEALRRQKEFVFIYLPNMPHSRGIPAALAQMESAFDEYPKLKGIAVSWGGRVDESDTYCVTGNGVAQYDVDISLLTVSETWQNKKSYSLTKAQFHDLVSGRKPLQAFAAGRFKFGC